MIINRWNEALTQYHSANKTGVGPHRTGPSNPYETTLSDVLVRISDYHGPVIPLRKINVFLFDTMRDIAEVAGEDVPGRSLHDPILNGLYQHRGFGLTMEITASPGPCRYTYLNLLELVTWFFYMLHQKAYDLQNLKIDVFDDTSYKTSCARGSLVW